MTHGSLFSGIGGFDLAAEWMGWENIFHCEWNPFGQKVLKHYWPKAISYHDITKSDFTIHRGNIDILTGGFPCQPYSLAGKRKGKEDERHLWPEMLRAIREIQPRWVVGENVLGLVNWNGGLVFDEVQADLEAQGYEVQPFVLPAAAVNAPHRRDRVWFVAYSKTNRQSQSEGINKWEKYKQDNRDRIWHSFNTNGSIGITPDTDHNGYATTENGQGLGEGNDRNKTGQNDAIEFEGRAVSDGVTPDTDTTRCKDWAEQHRGQSALCREGEHCSCGHCIGIDRPTPHPNSNGQHQCNCNNEINASEGRINALGNAEQGNEYGVAPGTDCKRHEERQPSTISNRQKRFDSETNYFGKPGSWHSFPTQSPICSRNDGIFERLDGITFSKWRNESIKAAGNAIVPQVVFQIFKAIEQYEQL